MLQRIRELAMEKLASEAEVDAFMEGFEKAAFDGNFLQTEVGKAVLKGAVGLGAGLIGAGIVKGFSVGSHAMVQSGLRNKFEMSLAQVMSTNKIIRGARPERTKEYANTIFNFAPHIASDPNLLGSILANAVLGESIDPQTIKTLVELEGRYVDNNKTNPLPGIRA